MTIGEGSAFGAVDSVAEGNTTMTLEQALIKTQVISTTNVGVGVALFALISSTGELAPCANHLSCVTKYRMAQQTPATDFSGSLRGDRRGATS